jgi:fumarylacetoacetate (FAA) hydrolase
MAMFLNYWEDVFPLAKAAEQKIQAGMVRSVMAQPFEAVQLLAPVPHPSSCRDAYAFRQHVAAARKNEMQK